MVSHHKEENQHNALEFISFSIKSLKDHHIAVIIASFVIYFAGFGGLFALTKTTVGGFFAFLPVIAIAWSFGIPGGFVGTVLIFIVQNMLEYIFRGEIAYFLPPLWMIIGYITIFVVGATVGYISSLNRKLNRALGEIKLLKGLVPVCGSCKRIRDDKGFWYPFEDYFRLTSAVRFEMMLCPQCEQLLFPEGEEDSIAIKTPVTPPEELPANVTEELKKLTSFQHIDLSHKLSEGVFLEMKSEIPYISRLLPIDQYKLRRMIQDKLRELLYREFQSKTSNGN